MFSRHLELPLHNKSTKPQLAGLSREAPVCEWLFDAILHVASFFMVFEVRHMSCTFVYFSLIKMWSELRHMLCLLKLPDPVINLSTATLLISRPFVSGVIAINALRMLRYFFRISLSTSYNGFHMHLC